jgi:hypothetical protein
MFPANVKRSMIAAQSRGSMKVRVQPEKGWLEAIAIALISPLPWSHSTSAGRLGRASTLLPTPGSTTINGCPSRDAPDEQSHVVTATVAASLATSTGDRNRRPGPVSYQSPPDHTPFCRTVQPVACQTPKPPRPGLQRRRA